MTSFNRNRHTPESFSTSNYVRRKATQTPTNLETYHGSKLLLVSSILLIGPALYFLVNSGFGLIQAGQSPVVDGINWVMFFSVLFTSTLPHFVMLVAAILGIRYWNKPREYAKPFTLGIILMAIFTIMMFVTILPFVDGGPSEGRMNYILAYLLISFRFLLCSIYYVGAAQNRRVWRSQKGATS